jgi:very-long-chain ceramide synthase
VYVGCGSSDQCVCFPHPFLHQLTSIGISVNLISMLYFIHYFFPAARHHTSKFFHISYYNPATGTFALGWDDIFFVFYWIIVFTGARCVTMGYILSPLAARCGIHKKKAKVRFAEQAWILLYPGFFCIAGFSILYKSDYWLNLRALWKNWPTRELEGITKWYYLVQFAFWLQQIVVVNIEERRKDYGQMFTHHIITCALIFTSYGYHQTKVGNVFLVTMDFVDVLLPFAKILKYLHFQRACDVAFGAFMVFWFVLRHVCFMWICWSVYAHIPEEIQYGCYKGSVTDLEGPFPIPDDWDHLTQPFRDPVGLVCWNNNVKWTFLIMLLALQGVLLVWFGMILRVAYKVITGSSADDIRSDDEDDDEEEEEASDDLSRKTNGSVQLGQVIEKVMLSSDADFAAAPSTNKQGKSPARQSSRQKKEKGHSSGVNILGSSDRKELLGRIGCEKSASD